MTLQLSLFDEPQSDQRPLPLIVATRWNFALTYIDTDSNVAHYLYSAVDWIKGLGGNKSIWSRFDKQLLHSTQQLPYKATDGKSYMVDFVSAVDLYTIAQEMRPLSRRPQLDAIRKYLSEAGVFTDRARLNPEKVAKELTARAKGIEARNSMTAAAHDTKDDKRPFYGVLTDAQYKILLGREKRKIVETFNMSPTEAAHFRDQLGEQALDALRMLEGAAAVKMRAQGRPLTHDEQVEIVIRCSEIVARSYHQLTAYLEVDNVRNQPMLASGNQ